MWKKEIHLEFEHDYIFHVKNRYDSPILIDVLKHFICISTDDKNYIIENLGTSPCCNDE